jgi:hypothetical protein
MKEERVAGVCICSDDSETKSSLDSKSSEEVTPTVLVPKHLNIFALQIAFQVRRLEFE